MQYDHLFVLGICSGNFIIIGRKHNEKTIETIARNFDKLGQDKNKNAPKHTRLNN